MLFYTKRVENGLQIIEYSMIWSNEDGGTDTPALMARWGRTADIEWIYRVTLDDGGHVLNDVVQYDGHQTKPFEGARLGDHPLLVTSTSNNNVHPVAKPDASTGYRFMLDSGLRLPEGRTREYAMDANPWSYAVMAMEAKRENKISDGEPGVSKIADLRSYLFVEIAKQTVTSSDKNMSVPIAIAVKRKGDPKWYESHRGISSLAIERDGPAATTVWLPAGTKADDIEAIRAEAVPVPGILNYRVTFGAVRRAFFLDSRNMPGPSIIDWQGAIDLTPEHPFAEIPFRQVRPL